MIKIGVCTEDRNAVLGLLSPSYLKEKLDALEVLMERVRQTIESIRLEENLSIKLSMSFGVVYGVGLAKEMFSEADKCLYEAKVRKNAVVIKPYR